MKPASLIFIIVALVLVLSGFILTRVAAAKAEQAGISLYTTATVEGTDRTVRTYDFTNSEIDKLILDFKDADIRFYQSEDGSSRVDLVNFDVGSFDIEKTNRMLNVTNNSRLLSLVDRFRAGNFNFNGLRDYFAGSSKANGEQVVNVYLGRESTARIISVSLEGGSVFMTALSRNSDFHIRVNGGSATLEQLSTGSVIEISTTGGEAILRDVCADTVTVSAQNGVTADSLTVIRALTAESTAGKITASVNAQRALYWLDLASKNGTISVDGTVTANPFTEIPQSYLNAVARGEEQSGTEAQTDGTDAGDETQEGETKAEEIRPIIKITSAYDLQLSFNETADTGEQTEPEDGE